ncbi:MarR family winged helix-turn-helix transcriptional regulator [Hephaestia sp. GCM10023244]|uniref:MarR family winged helix-turn-helix transcriptional regulator n=1 Tax=unclassified Hephaestia TaxID=2631281 RepID=UPI0020773732|nr:MarR family transcriptional regulator [Hephaestia sp. MAHUQ-44]MCM8732259.1 MarR family transcriptional regulator [Hephaestia sp. MAHUQ-44]
MGKTVRPKSGASALSILHLIKQVQYKAYVRLESVLNPLDVTAVQFRILTTLSTRPNLSSAELARLYDVKPQTMIKQIALLEAKKLIGRRVSDANKRLLELTLTEVGKDTLKKLQKDTRALEDELLQVLDADAQADLREHLTRLLVSMEGAAAGDGDRNAEEFAREYSRAGVQRL